MTREEAVLALGSSLLDYLPQAKGSTSSMTTTPGLVGSGRKPCGTCGARGRVSRKGHPCASCAPLVGVKSGAPHWGASHGCVPCPTCDGTGWVKSRKDDLPYDSYAREPASAVTRSDTSRDLEVRLARTTLLLALWESPESVEEAWVTKRKAQFRSGDYPALVRALRALEEQMPRRASLWTRAVVYGEPLDLGEGSRRALDETTSWLAELMPDEIRVPHHLQPDVRAQASKRSIWHGKTPAHGRLRSERDREIVRQRFELGWTLPRIARHHFLTKQRVQQIVSQASGVGT